MHRLFSPAFTPDIRSDEEHDRLIEFYIKVGNKMDDASPASKVEWENAIETIYNVCAEHSGTCQPKVPYLRTPRAFWLLMVPSMEYI